MTSRRALLLINAVSRRGDEDLSAAIRHITDDGWELTIFRPQTVEEMQSLIVERGSEMDRVIVAGLLRAIPGQKVDPEAEAAPPATH